MAIAAVSQLHRWGVARIDEALRQVTDEIARIARSLGLDVDPREQRGGRMLGVRLPGSARERVISALADRGCFAALRGAARHVALPFTHLHVTSLDLQRLGDALTAFDLSCLSESLPTARC